MVIKKLSEIADRYEYEVARTLQLARETRLFTEYRNLYDAKKICEKMELSSIRVGSDPYRLAHLGFKAHIQILLKDFNGAEKSLNQIDGWHGKQAFVPPPYASHYLYTKFSFNMELFEESILSKSKSIILKHRKNAYKSSKKMLINSRKYAVYRTGALKLMGLYYWLISKQNKAVKWWQKAVEEGERLSARPELARTYMEIGKRFLEEKSKYKELNGISAKEYLEKARIMFQEMDLQWDLDELDKIEQ